MNRKALIALGFLCAFLPALAAAKTLPVNKDDPVATITVPDDWATGTVKRGIEIRSPDEEVWVWFELAAPADMPALQKEHDDYFKKEGVTFTGQPETKAGVVDGRNWSFTDVPAKDEDGDPTTIRYVAINPNLPSGKILLMTYWGSEDGNKTHDKAMDALIKSLTFK